MKRDKLGFWINIHTLLHIKQVNNKDLLYSTGNYTSYPLITYNGKDSEKESVIYLSLNHFDGHLDHCNPTPHQSRIKSK